MAKTKKDLVPSVPKLREVQLFVHDHRNRWNQTIWLDWVDEESKEKGYWKCGTVGCIAGHAALLNGYKPYTGNVVFSGPTVVPVRGGTRQHVDEVAQRVLGLNDDQAEELFWGSNSLDEIDRYIDDICEGEGRELLEGYKVAKTGKVTKVKKPKTATKK